MDSNFSAHDAGSADESWQEGAFATSPEYNGAVAHEKCTVCQQGLRGYAWAYWPRKLAVALCAEGVKARHLVSGDVDG